MPSLLDLLPPSEASPSPVDGSLVGRRVDKYEIGRVIGRGGMGTVYEALNTAIGKRVAMKFVDAEAAQSRDSVARFHREAESASAVESAHIVDIFDSGVTDDGQPYIVMELLRGEDLGHRIRRCGRLELAEAVHVTAQILRGLHRAHEAGIVHRDLKPDNIFLVDHDDDPSFAKILDFGISKVHRAGGTPVHTLTREGTVLGTPFYMSPEQAQALPEIDGRTDLWSVGTILYECLTGRPPHTGATYEQVIVNICMNDADDVRVHNPGVPEAIAKVLVKALARDRDARFAGARDFLAALKAAAGAVITELPGSAAVDDTGSGVSSNDFRITPVAPASDANANEGGVFDPTLKFIPGGANGRGAASDHARGRRDRRTFAIVAVAALLVGSGGALLVARGQHAGSDAASEVTVQLRATIDGARFSVGGVPVAGGLLRGAKGDMKRVRIEADGHAPLEIEVKLDTERELAPIELTSSSIAAVSPSVETAAVAVITPATSAAAATVDKTGHEAGKAAAIKATATASPQATGVAGQLKLKVE